MTTTPNNADLTALQARAQKAAKGLRRAATSNQNVAGWRWYDHTNNLLAAIAEILKVVGGTKNV